MQNPPDNKEETIIDLAISEGVGDNGKKLPEIVEIRNIGLPVPNDRPEEDSPKRNQRYALTDLTKLAEHNRSLRRNEAKVPQILKDVDKMLASGGLFYAVTSTDEPVLYARREERGDLRFMGISTAEPAPGESVVLVMSDVLRIVPLEFQEELKKLIDEKAKRISTEELNRLGEEEKSRNGGRNGRF